MIDFRSDFALVLSLGGWSLPPFSHLRGSIRDDREFLLHLSYGGLDPDPQETASMETEYSKTSPHWDPDLNI